jgi:NADH:ubiquinone oxidoreductase subunit F (NADH-binding)
MGELRVLFQHRDVPGIENLAVYEQHGGYSALRKALGMTRQQVIDEVKASGVRGRGGCWLPRMD